MTRSRLDWLRLVYGGELAGGSGRARPAEAARLLAGQPELVDGDPLLACAVGNEEMVRRALVADPGWVNRAGGVLNVPPLIAVTHSSLVKRAEFRAPILGCLRLVLDSGADPNAAFFNRAPPNSLERPGEEKLTAIYGAAGKLHDEEMTALLLAGGADPNDNESLYHSIEDPRPHLPCTKLLLEAGARVAGSNALAKVLDYDNLDGLKMLLAYTEQGDPDLGRILHWAIYRGRSAAHVQALVQKGADPRSLDRDHQDAFQHAASAGLPEVMRLLEQGGTGEPLTDAEKFVSACTRADDREARRLLAANPALISTLTPAQLRQLPNMAMAGRDDAVRLMVELGWPIATRGGDIDGSALNWAVFRGQPQLAEFLLRHGASFRERHGYESDVLGTLSWASLNEPNDQGDWCGCAATLRAHGLPPASLPPDEDQAAQQIHLRIDGRTLLFPQNVARALLGIQA